MGPGAAIRVANHRLDYAVMIGVRTAVAAAWYT